MKAKEGLGWESIKDRGIRGDLEGASPHVPLCGPARPYSLSSQIQDTKDGPRVTLSSSHR